MDSWEDDDFDVPTFNTAPTTNGVNKTSWEDEEEEEEPKPVEEDFVPKEPTPKQKAKKEKKEKEAKRKAEEEEIRKKLELQAAILKNETEEERRIRERREIEEADNELTEELFDGNKKSSDAKVTAEAGIENITLNSLEDYMKLAMKLGKRLNNSEGHHVLAFFKEMLRNSTDALDADGVGELVGLANVIKNEKVKAARGKKKTTKKIQKKDAAAKAKHDETFGGDFDGSKYDTGYDDVYDDFM